MTLAVSRSRAREATYAVPKSIPLVGHDQLALAGAQLAEQEHLTAEMAAIAILDRMQPNRAATVELVRIGLARGIQAYMNEAIKETATADPTRERSARQAAVAPSRVLGDPLMLTLVVNGTRHSLLHFTLADWQFVEADRGSRAVTALAQQKVAKLAIELLVREGKATTGELSAKALASLRPIAKKAWS